MGDGLNRSCKLAFLALAGLSGFVISCSGVAPTVSRLDVARADAQASAAGLTTHVRLESDPATRPAADSVRTPFRVDDDFDAPALEQQFEKIARRVSRSVVAISGVDFPVKDDSVHHPDQTTPQKLDAAVQTQDRTVGTGFVIDAAAGFVLTNEHVVGKCRQLWVTTDDHKVYPAVVVGSDPRSDLAVLKIPARDLVAVKFAPAPARRGQWTLAIGNPYGLAGDGEMAVSVGIVSAVGRSLPKLAGKEDRLYQDLIQTTAQINPGNSGGPLFDLNGDVVGVNCAVILPVKQTNGIGFAIPAGARLQSVIDRLKAGQEVTYAFVGVRTSTPTDQEFREAGLKDLRGARIDSIEPQSPAQAAGLLPGDVVRAIGGSTIADGEQFVQLVGDSPVGQPISFSIYRGGKSQTIAVTPTPRSLASLPVTRLTQRFTWKGLLLGTRSTEPGVVVFAIEPGSPLAGTVKVGETVESLGGVRLGCVADVIDALSNVPMEQCVLKTVAATGTVVTARE